MGQRVRGRGAIVERRRQDRLLKRRKRKEKVKADDDEECPVRFWIEYCFIGSGCA